MTGKEEKQIKEWTKWKRKKGCLIKPAHAHTQPRSMLSQVKPVKVSQVLTEAGWSCLLIAAAH